MAKIDTQAKIAAALAAGAMLRTSSDYKAHTFTGQEKVVSEWGTEGVVLETRAGRPSKILVDCQLEGCKNQRIIASQDFFQVIACSDAHKKELNKQGLERKGVNKLTGTGRSKSVPKLVKDALELGLMDEATAKAALEAHAKKIAENRAANTGNTEEARKARVLAALQKRGLLPVEAEPTEENLAVEVE